MMRIIYYIKNYNIVFVRETYLRWFPLPEDLDFAIIYFFRFSFLESGTRVRMVLWKYMLGCV